MISFKKAYAAPPKVILCPANSVAAALAGNGQVFARKATITKNSFEIVSGGRTLVAGDNYSWTYQVVEK